MWERPGIFSVLLRALHSSFSPSISPSSRRVFRAGAKFCYALTSIDSQSECITELGPGPQSIRFATSPKAVETPRVRPERETQHRQQRSVVLWGTWRSQWLNSGPLREQEVPWPTVCLQTEADTPVFCLANAVIVCNIKTNGVGYGIHAGGRAVLKSMFVSFSSLVQRLSCTAKETCHYLRTRQRDRFILLSAVVVTDASFIAHPAFNLI